MSAISNITTIVNTRMEEALERLKNKIISTLPEEVAEEFGEINISSFVKKAMKGFEDEIKEEISKIESKKIGKTKDKNAPKGAKNAYIFFCAEKREQVKEENSEMNAKEIVSELARLWQEADEDVKAEYQEKAAQDKQRYQEEMAGYVPSDEEASPKTKNSKGSAKKDPNAPKGAKNAYIFFCADNREQVKEENPEMKSTEIVSELARLWQEVDEDMKAKYQQKASEDKQRYQEEMSDYVPSDEEASPKGKGSAKKGSAKKDPNAPKGAKNAYILFCADNREQVKEENSEMSSKEIISELARLWKEADEDVKAEYQEKAAQDKQRYQEEMEEYSDGEKEEKSPKKEEPKKTSKAEEAKSSKKEVKSPKKEEPKKTSKAEEVKSSKKEEVKKTSKKEEPKEEVKSPKKTSKKEEPKEEAKSPKKTSKKEEPKEEAKSPKKTSKKEVVKSSKK